MNTSDDGALNRTLQNLDGTLGTLSDRLATFDLRSRRIRNTLRATIAIGVAVVLVFGLALWSARDSRISSCHSDNKLRGGIRDFIEDILGPDPTAPAADASQQDKAAYDLKIQQRAFARQKTAERFSDRNCANA